MTPPVFRDYLSALRPLACARPAQHKHHLHLQQVSICTFVLVKQVKPQLLPHPLTPQLPRTQIQLFTCFTEEAAAALLALLVQKYKCCPPHLRLSSHFSLGYWWQPAPHTGYFATLPPSPTCPPISSRPQPAPRTFGVLLRTPYNTAAPPRGTRSC